MARKKRRIAAAKGSSRQPARIKAVSSAVPAPLLFLPWHRRFSEALRALWRKISPAFVHRFLVSLVIAIVIEGALHLLHTYHPSFHDLEDRALDWTVGMSRGAVPPRQDSVGYTFLDIDERTYRDWDEPAEIPREKLALLIERTLAACPRLLIVDVDLTQPSRISPEGDAALLQVLLDQAAAPLSERCLRRPSILFPVTLREREALDANRENALWERRPSFLEPALAGISNVAWASPLFERASDWQIRRWRPWERTCPQRESRPEVVPSLQLLSAGVLAGLPLSAVMEKIHAKVGPTLEPCSEHQAGKICESHEEEGGPQLQFGTLALSICPSRLNQRIVYRYPAPGELGEGESYPRHATNGQLLNVVPAAPLARIDPLNAPDPKIFQDRMVVIGGSFQEGRDVYRTPLGPMPGALILINATDSLIEHGEIKPPVRSLRYGVLLFSLLVMSLIFTAFPPLKSLLIAFSLILFILLPASLLLFQNGYWLDFAIPIVAVFLHKAVADIHKGHTEETR